MKKNDVVIKVNPENREVYFNDNFAGVNAENLQSNLVFEFDGEFVNGTPRVEVEKDGEKYIITDVSKVEDTYVMEIKSSLLTTDVIWLQLVITEVGEEEIPIFKSRKFYLVVKESINADTELPDEYQTLYDQIEEKIAEVENLNVAGERVSDGVEITFTDKLGNETTEKVNDGEPGKDGKDGVDGEDGFSPIANVEKVGKTATITITDKTGTTTASISDGEVPQDIIDQVDLNSMVYNTLPKITGNSDTINDTSNTPMELELLGNTEQGDNPSPDYPQEIHTVTGDNTIIISNSDNTLSQTYPITLGNLEMCKIGNYSDKFVKATNEIGLISGKWYLKKNIKKYTFTGNETINSEYSSATRSGFWILFNDILSYTNANEKPNILTTKFISVSMNETWVTGNVSMTTYEGSTQRVRFFLEANKTTDDLKNVLINQPIYYVLQTPEYILLNDTLQTELNNIQKAVSYNEQTNIIQVNDDLPFILNYSANKNVPTKTSELENDSGYVKRIDYSTYDNAGVVKRANQFDVNGTNGQPYCSSVEYSNYSSLNNSAFISKGTLENVITGKGLVSNTDYASSSTAGVIKTNSNYGTTMINGYLGGDERSFAGYNQMTNYGLIGKGTLENVITGKGLVKDTDYASSSTAGVIKTAPYWALATQQDTGNMYAQEKTYSDYTSGASTMFISKGTLENVITGKGLTNVAHTNSNNNFTTAQTVNGTLTVNGDIVQSGQSYETHAEQLFTKNDLIKTRDGAIGGLASNEVTGIEAINYDGANNGRLVFDNTGTARVGDVGDEVPLLARDESLNLIDGQVLVWDSTDLVAKGSSDYVKNTDYATSAKGGVVKTGSNLGILINQNGNPYIDYAQNTDIDAKTSYRKPIVPATLDYAVKVGVTTNVNTLTDTEKTNACNWLGTGKMVTLTQAEYDALVSGGTVDANTYYFIEEE